MFVNNVAIDWLVNGQLTGGLEGGLSGHSFDPLLLRPYLNDKGKPVCLVNTGRYQQKKKADGTLVLNAEGISVQVPVIEEVLVKDLLDAGIHSPVFNSTTLTKDSWKFLDSRVVTAARKRLRAWADLSSASSVGGFNGMNHTLYEYETVTDDGRAISDMDGLSEGTSDQSQFTLEAVPLPITHSSFTMSSRVNAVGSNRGTPLRVTRAEQAGRRVAETIEQTLIGSITGVQYGTTSLYGRTPKVYGYTNFPDRVTKTDMTAPDGTNGTTVLNEWLEVIDLLKDVNFYGPFAVYVSRDYDQYLDGEFKTNSDKSLRTRLLEVESISSIKSLDYLTTAASVLFVQLSSEVVEAINAMPITVVQWETKGGMQLNFKVMAIQVPKIIADASGNCGIAHATTS